MKKIKGVVESIQQNIQNQVGKQRAIIAVSGGIDSSVCAILSNAVISKQLYPLYIRTGFNLDKEEKDLVRLFDKHRIKVNVLKKEEEFFNKLRNIGNSLKRRYAFGVISLKNIKKYAESIGASVLINGVNKNDKIVSNVVNPYKQRAREVKKVLGLKLVEPIANLYKTEVKEIAREIELKELINKQHIPGPALSVRIAGKITKRKLNLLKDINEFINTKIENRKELWQYFPFLLTEKLDNKYLVVLRFVSSKDGLKAKVNYNKKLIEPLAQEILKKFPEIGRVFFDVSPKPPTTIELM